MKVAKEQLKDPSLTRFQDNVNRALGKVGFDYSTRLDVTCRPEEFPKLIPHGLPLPAWGLQTVYLRNKTLDTTVPTAGIFVDWIPEAGGVTIRQINGLTAANLYEIRFLVYA